jgi:hypothetical protein
MLLTPLRCWATSRQAFSSFKNAFSLGQKKELYTDAGEKASALMFQPQEQRAIQQQLDRCQYGLGWHWMEKQSQIAIRPVSDGIFFSNFRLGRFPKPTGEKKLKGDCLQLSLQVGRALVKQLGARYQFYLAKGNFGGSPWQRHFFLVSWPKKLDTQIKNGMQYSLDKKSDIKHLPTGAVVIDPTYNKIQQIEKEKAPSNPFLLTDPQGQPFLVDVNQIMAPTDHLLSTWPQGKSPAVPLGFVQDTWPGFAEFAEFKETPDTVTCLRFQEQKQQAYPRVQLILASSAQTTEVKDWKTAVPKNTPLYKMLRSVEQKLQESPQRLF